MSNELPPAGVSGNALRRQTSTTTKRNETALNTAIALKSLANHLSTSTLKKRRAAAKKKQGSVEGPAASKPAFKTRPGTPSRQQSNGKISAYKFLRRSSSKVTPSCNGGGTVQQTSSALPPLNNSRKNSKASELLATIPVCGLQKCLLKYGCGHCL